MFKLNTQVDIRAQHHIKLEESKRIKDRLDRLTGDIKEECSKFVNTAVTDPSTKAKIEELKRIQKSQLEIIERRLIEKSNQMFETVTKASVLKTTIDGKISSQNAKMVVINRVCEGRDFEQALNEAESAVDEHRENVASLRSATTMYTKFIEKSRQNHNCPLCARGFDEQQEEENFLNKMNSILARVPTSVKLAEDELAAWESKRQAIRNLVPLWEESRRISQELPKHREDLRLLEEKEVKVREEIGSDEDEKANITAKIQEKDLLISRLEEIGELISNLQGNEKEIERLSKLMGLSGTGSHDISDIKKQIDEVKDRCKLIQSKIDRTIKEQMLKREQLSAKELQLRDYNDQLTSKRHAMSERARLEEEISRKKEDIDRCLREMDECDLEMSRLAPQQEELQRRLSHCRQINNNKRDQLDESIRKIQQDIDTFSKLQNDISDYLMQQKHLQLSTIENEIRLVDASVQKLKNQLQDIDERISQLKERLSQVKIVQRKIQDNLQYRSMKRKVEECTRTIADLNKQASKYDKESYQTQMTNLQRQHAMLLDEKSGLEGELRQLQVQNAQLERELQNEYKDIDQKYKNQLIKLKVSFH